MLQAMILSLQSNNTRTTQLEEENAVQANQILTLQNDVTDLQDAVLIAQTDIITLQGIVAQLQLDVVDIQTNCCP